MRKLYNELFYIPKHGKVREKVMLAHVVLTVLIMVACLAAMSMASYAFFSHNVTSASNTIQAANFEANVLITDSNNAPITVTKNATVQTANLEAGNYTIELSKGSSTADKGFCVITIGDKTYYTDQIGVDADKKLTDATVKFELRLSAPIKIEICSHWGTSVYYSYKDDGNSEIFVVSGDVVDLTTQTMNDDEPAGSTSTPSTNTTPDTASPSTQAPESPTTPSTETPPAETTPPENPVADDPASTTDPDASTTDSTTLQPDQPTGDVDTDSADSTETPVTQPATGETTNASTTGAAE